MEWLSVGPCPSDEECIQVNKDGSYYEPMMAECRRYKKLLESIFPNARFRVKTYPHDFGTYAEVEVLIRDESDFAIEDMLPSHW